MDKVIECKNTCKVHVGVDKDLQYIKESIDRILEKIATKASKEALDDTDKALRHEMDDLKRELESVAKSAIVHGESLASIQSLLVALNDNQAYFRVCLEKLTDCYTKSAENIAIISTKLTDTDTDTDNKSPKTLWQFISGNKPLVWLILGIGVILCYLLIAEWHDIVTILSNWGTR